MNIIQRKISRRGGLSSYFKATFVVVMALACMAGCKDENKDKESDVVGGKLEIGGKTYSLDSATWAYYAMSERGVLRLLHSEDAVNINFKDLRTSDIPIGTFIHEEAAKATLGGVHVDYGGMLAPGNDDSKVVISKSGNRYSITATGTSRMITGEYKVTYKGSVRKAN